MSIEKFIAKVCVQTAVYWGNPAPNSGGDMEYDDPVEIPCRWDDKTEVKSDGNGNEIVCRAEILVTQDLDEQGYLFLGHLNDLDSNQYNDPMSVEGAYSIKVVEKTPMIRSTSVFVRCVYL